MVDIEKSMNICIKFFNKTVIISEMYRYFEQVKDLSQGWDNSRN